MKVNVPGIALLLTCCCVGAAKADWEYTKWGMTPAEVVNASRNQAKADSNLRPDSDGNVTKLTAPFKSAKYTFEAQFGFDAADKLSSVTLVLYDEAAGTDMHMEMHGSADAHMHMDMDKGICQDLKVNVDRTHGEPTYQGANHLYAIEKWRDEKNKNNVDYHSLYGVGCYVQYSVMK
jgi:hypothetical protein